MTALQKRTDRRISKTQRRLHGALDALIRKKPYDSISVREILERASIGRSTFYVHFRDKDELLASGIRDMLGSALSTGPPRSTKPFNEMLAFNLPVFEHIHEHRRAGRGTMGARGRTVLHEHLRDAVTKSIADDVAKRFRARDQAANAMPHELLIEYLASTFILVLNWWVESGSRLAPAEADELFRALVLPTLSAICEGDRAESRDRYNQRRTRSL